MLIIIFVHRLKLKEDMFLVQNTKQISGFGGLSGELITNPNQNLLL